MSVWPANESVSAQWRRLGYIGSESYNVTICQPNGGGEAISAGVSASLAMKAGYQSHQLHQRNTIEMKRLKKLNQ